MNRPRPGLIALSVFFASGALLAGLAGFSLLVPGIPLQWMWRLNPQAHAALVSAGTWAIALMFAVAVACALAAGGLWVRVWWGQRLAVGLLLVNLFGNVTTAVVRGEWRALVGLPVAAALIAYLLSPGVRREFQVRNAAG